MNGWPIDYSNGIIDLPNYVPTWNEITLGILSFVLMIGIIFIKLWRITAILFYTMSIYLGIFRAKRLEARIEE